MAVVSRGTGREDYSKDIFTSTVPLTKSHQYRLLTSGLVDLTSLAYMTIADEAVYGDWVIASDYRTTISTDQNIMIYSIRADFDSNVLIKAKFVKYDMNTETYTTHLTAYGYNSVEFKFPKGYLMSGTDLVTNAIAPGIALVPGGYNVRFTLSAVVDQYAGGNSS